MEENVSSELVPLAALESAAAGDVSTLQAQLKSDIDAYMSPLLLVVGSLGNLTSLVVLARLSRKVSRVNCAFVCRFVTRNPRRQHTS